MHLAEYQRDAYTISNDPARLNVPFIYEFLTTQTDWGRNRTLEVVRRSVENSLNFGVYHGGQQVGFARVITDYATFAWLCDVFIVPAHSRTGWENGWSNVWSTTRTSSPSAA